VTTSWWKEERGTRLFIDYNQNARDRTFASAYSARKTPIATVSTPLTWDELREADPDDYTIATVPKLVAGRDDPWADIDSAAQSLSRCCRWSRPTRNAGLATCHPPNYPKMPGEPKRAAEPGYGLEEGTLETTMATSPIKQRGHDVAAGKLR
jgi:hypothetical protein